MKFAICNELFQGWEPRDIFKFVSEIGYQGIEIAPFTLAKSVTEISPEQRRSLRREAEEFGLGIVGLHWLLVSPPGLFINHPEAGIRQKTLSYFQELIKFGHDLGGEIMVVGSPKQRNVWEGQLYEEAWEMTKQFFLECLPAAEKEGVTLCLEPLSPAETNFINTAEEGIRFVREIAHPNFKLILDVKAMSSEKMPIPQIIAGAREYLAHFHANDANMRGPGFGDTDFRLILEALTDINYQGYVSIEVFDYQPDAETIARKSYQYLIKVQSLGK